MIRRLLILLLILYSVGSWQTTVTAKGQTIQERIQNAKDGATLVIPQGIYHEDLVINKPVSLIGENNVVIIGSGNDNVITVTAPGVTLKHLSIQHSGLSLEKDQAAVKLLSGKNRLIDLKISDSLHGIYLNASSENLIQDCTIEGIPSLDRSSRGNGIHLFHSGFNRIINNTIHHTRDGIYFSFSESNEINGNNVHDTRYGLHYMYSNLNHFSKNSFHDNIGGAAIMYSNKIKLVKNEFYNNHGMRSFGVLFQSSNDNKLTDNKFVMNQKGIFMDQSNHNLFIQNDFSYNKIGAEIWSSSTGNIFSENHFISNTIQYSSNGSVDHNSWSINGIGNAWSDQALFDLDNNGIGDDPYIYSSSFGGALTQNQLGYLFLDSPAIKLFENFHQLFSGNVVELTDPYPIPLKRTSSNAIFVSILMAVFFGILIYGKGRA